MNRTIDPTRQGIATHESEPDTLGNAAPVTLEEALAIVDGWKDGYAPFRLHQVCRTLREAYGRELQLRQFIDCCAGASSLTKYVEIVRMAGSVRKQKYISRDDVRSQRSAVFVFGDNMQRKGFGGQARAMRGEPNTVGIPTKWTPDNRVSAYFTDDDLSNRSVMEAINSAFDKIKLLRSQGCDIVFPEDGVGTGLADLPRRAPKLHSYIEARIKAIATDG